MCVNAPAQATQKYYKAPRLRKPFLISVRFQCAHDMILNLKMLSAQTVLLKLQPHKIRMLKTK
jgi:hypothetical protein